MDDNSRYFDRTRDNGDNFEQKPFIVSPEFADIEGAGDNARGSNSERNNDAAKRGKLREQLAAAGSDVGRRYLGPSMSDAVSDARRAEKGEEDGSGFKNNVQGRSLERAAAASMPFGKFIAKKAKSMGPFGTIILILLVAGGMLMGTQSLAPFGIVANGLEHFNTLRTSMNKRSTYFQRFMLSSDRNYPVTKGATIFKPERFAIGGGLKKRMAKNGIQFVNDRENSVKYLVYTDDTGKRFAISANDTDIGKIPNSVKIDGETLEINTKTKIDNALLESDDFLHAFDKSTRTLKGHIAGWFDDTSDLLHKYRLKNSRNKLKGSTDSEGDEGMIKRAKSEGMNEGIEDTKAQNMDEGGDGELKQSQKNEATGDVTTSKYTDEDIKEGGDGMNYKNGNKPANIKNETAANLSSKMKKMSAAAGKMNLICAVLKIGTTVGQLMAGVVKSNILNYVSFFLEAVDKTKAGDAKDSVLMKLMNLLYKKGDTVAYVNSGNGYEEKVVKSDTSAMESAAMSETFSDGKYGIGDDQSSKEIAGQFNLESVSKVMLGMKFGGIGEDGSSAKKLITDALSKFTSTNNIDMYKSCMYMSVAAASAGLVADVLGVMSFGIGTVVKQIAENIIQAATKVAFSLIIAEVVKIIVPYVARWLVTDFLTDVLGGELPAYAIRFGMQEYAGAEQQASSGFPATMPKMTLFYRAHQDVIASEAEIERRDRSPFDVTSKYTFLGSIVNSLTPMAATLGAPISVVSKTMTTLGSSIGSMLPTAKADGEVEFKSSLSAPGDCPALDNLGIVGDAACNPYFITDMSTMDMDPAEVFNKVATDDSDNFIDAGVALDSDSNAFILADSIESNNDDDGNPEINPKSTLGKWVIACASRDSQFGTVDSNVLNAVQFVNTGNGTLDGVIGSGIGMIPFVGDIVDGAQALRELGNIGWATGENCVSEKYKYYSRYSEDQRLMESAGIIKQSAVSKMLEKYYEENPIDNSYEGTIARYSGLTKEEVTDTIAAIEYVQFIADYNPETYGPETQNSKPGKYQFDSNEIVAFDDNYGLTIKQVAYYDLRNRTKIA